MKLLIVDDEQLTREGLIHSIDWQSLGINNIYQADDGIHGLALSRKYQPEIILSDVRMPRMDGIEMANQIRNHLPDCNIIFMSGYSDKEYLKAAIKLKAISYVEKPIDLEEIRAAVSEAVQNHSLLLKDKQNKSRRKQEEQEKLANMLSYMMPEESSGCCIQMFLELGFPIKPAFYFTTLIIKLYPPISSLAENVRSSFIQSLHSILEKHHMDCIYTNKQDEYYIIHIFGADKPELSILKHIAAAISASIKTFAEFDMAFGKTVSSPAKVSASYNTAVILLQSTFFTGPGKILYQHETPSVHKHVQLPEWPSLFMELLKDHAQEKSFSLAQDIYDFFAENSFLLPGQAKDTYYRLFNRLHEAARTEHITLSDNMEENITNWDYIESCHHLSEMHERFLKLLGSFYEKLESENNDNSVIYLIKEFINQKYQDDSLSVKDISEHVYLSSSYVCTIFKTETGQTLNQYLTEFRLDKAKRLLEDPRYKIAEISSRVGYSDGNYFGKIFKKNVGLSPSEYREKNTK